MKLYLLYFLMLMVMGAAIIHEEAEVKRVAKKQKRIGNRAAWKVWYRTVYLNSPHWKRVRKKALERDNYQCRRCGSRDRLQVHHLTYTFITVEHRHMSCLLTLCERCHRREHGL